MSNLLFRVFSDPIRRRALRLLARRALCVCDLTDALRLPQPTVSRHLGALQRAGLVRVEKRGKWRHYTLINSRDKVARALLASLDGEGDTNGDLKRLSVQPVRRCE